MPHAHKLLCCAPAFLLFMGAALLAHPSHVQAQEAALPDMSGSWAQLQVTTSISKIPVVGEVVAESRSLILLTVTQDGGKLSLKEQMCDINVTSSAKRVKTVIPGAFVRAASGATRQAKVWNDGGTLRFEEAPKVIVLGAKLKDPRRDALPEDEDDERVIDPDKDGNPGLTVVISGIIDGEVYVVQRGWNKLTGVIDADAISGSVTWGSEQRVVDASSVFLNSNTDSTPHKDAAKSWFRMKRVSESMTCKDLKSKQKSVFGL